MIRIQIAVDNTLKAEAVVESFAEADKLWARYTIRKYHTHDTYGCALIQLSALPRFWNVKIGDKINETKITAKN